MNKKYTTKNKLIMTYTLKYSLQAFCTEHLTPVSGIPLSNAWNTHITDTGIPHNRYWNKPSQILASRSFLYALQITDYS